MKTMDLDVFMLLCELLDEEECRNDSVRGCSDDEDTRDKAIERSGLITKAKAQLYSVNRAGKR